MLRRYELTDQEWNRIKDLLPPEKSGKRGRPSKDNRMRFLYWILLIWPAVRLQQIVVMMRIKSYRRIATRYDKLACTYLGFIAIASILVWLK